MKTARLEAFSDGVLAIVITIMVLEMKVPHDPTLAGLSHLLPVFLSYVLSFVLIAIYWINHHHMMHLAHHVTPRILWLNIHLLFWLSLVPFVTGYMGENHAAALPVALYGVVCSACAVAYYLLRQEINCEFPDRAEVAALDASQARKGRLALYCYLASIPFAFVSVYLSFLCFVAPAAMYFVPDRRNEQHGA
ncbi:MAG: TMEM175 family protein [Pseudomonadota bacterium]